MAEKLLVAQALDERDFLYKKIMSLIYDTTFTDVVKEKDTSYLGKPITEVTESIKATYQSIVDQIDRYNRICKAITLSNANTTITFKNGKTITVAEALALKGSINGSTKSSLEELLIDKLEKQVNEVAFKKNRIESEQEKNRDRYINTQLANQDSKQITTEFATAIDQIIAPFNPKVIDPINAAEKLANLREHVDAVKAEIDTLIKISNATTYIEF